MVPQELHILFGIPIDIVARCKLNYSDVVYAAVAADKVTPQFQRRSPGEETSFHCDSDTKPTWLFDYDQSLFPDVKLYHNDRYLVINNTKEYHQGYYVCHGYDSNDQEFFLGSAMLWVEGKGIVQSILQQNHWAWSIFYNGLIAYGCCYLRQYTK